MDMDLGIDSGRQLLRVVIQMVMVNHAPLASQALQLLIRHFSQRKEMVEGFKQVHIFSWRPSIACTCTVDGIVPSEW